MTDIHIETHHEEILKRLDLIDKRFDMIETKLNPVYEIFSNVKDFNKITIWILKAVILLGTGIGVIYGLIRWLKNYD